VAVLGPSRGGRKARPVHGLAKGPAERRPVVHADETGTRVGTSRHWVHTLSTNLLTLLAVHPKRGAKALDDIGVLADYLGVIVHDGWAPYERLTSADHAQCGAHLIRHLNAVGETPEFSIWCAQMVKVLLDAKAASRRLLRPASSESHPDGKPHRGPLPRSTRRCLCPAA